jgi:hypothetical protein
VSTATGILDSPISGSAPYRTNSQGSASLIWLAGIGSALVFFALAAAGQAAILRIAIPTCATLTALTFYLRRPIGYIHFSLWAWFATAFVRRLVDWRFGYQDQSLVLLTPFLVSSIAGLTLVRERRNALNLQLAPFLLCIAGISYGFIVGIIRWRLGDQGSVTLAANVYGLATWLAPILFGLHIYLRWPMYEEQTRAIQKSFMIAVLGLGIYGIIQYVIAPPWDTSWLEGAGTNGGTFGSPEPYMIRVFSTANSPLAFASIMETGLILLFVIRTPYKLLTNAAGYTSFLLSLVRTAWLGWVIGVVILLGSYRGTALRRAILALFILPLCLMPVMLVPQVGKVVQDRLLTFQQLAQDQSFQDRKHLYQDATQEVFATPTGQGLIQANEVSEVRTGVDSGILSTPLKLGFTGTALLVLGLVMGAATTARSDNRGTARTAEELAHRAVFFATLAGIVSGSIFVGVNGVILWTFFALWMSAATIRRVPESGTRP